jgi:uncharacterized protein YkvS
MKTLDELKTVNIAEKAAIQEQMSKMKGKIDKLTDENVKFDGKFAELLKLMDANLEKTTCELKEQIKEEVSKIGHIYSNKICNLANI